MDLYKKEHLGLRNVVIPISVQQRIADSYDQERLRKRPRMPAGLSADQKAKNREIVKRMQMKAG